MLAKLPDTIRVDMKAVAVTITCESSKRAPPRLWLFQSMSVSNSCMADDGDCDDIPDRERSGEWGP